MNLVQRVTPASGKTRCVARCLGRFRLEDPAGNPLPIRSRKSRALLAVLAVTGRPWSRDRIADLLWSDRGPAQAKGSLRQSVFELHHLDEDRPLLVVGRDDLSIDCDKLVTDLDLLHALAVAGEWDRLLTLLRQSESGFLSDLDGLDMEMDDWLRSERARQPGATLTRVVEASERCAIEAGPRLACDLLTEVVRLEPDNELAVRAALRLEHALGDTAGLRRHYSALRERLRTDYGAEPAAETVELFNELSFARVPTVPVSPPHKEAGPGVLPPRKPVSKLAAAATVLAVLPILLVLLLSRAGAPPASESVLLAVLPFEQQGPPAGYIAEALWDDTRSAIARNGGVRVLGRATMEAAARQRLTPRQLRKRFGATYLLEGVVRETANQVRVAVSLTRISDGVAIWEDSFLAPAGDSVSLQGRIANGIEGKLRGRLARGGGRRSDQINTSPPVYALYSEARALIHARKPIQMARARMLLLRAVELDSNFAPAWSSLAAATYFESSGPAGAAEKDKQALAAARRAIALAPNLAEAHAILALIEGDNSPTSEAPLRRALALDPSYPEAWNWLGNALASQSRATEAVAAYKRALDLDPLWSTPALNLLSVAREAGDREALKEVFAKLSGSGADPELIHTIQAEDRLLAGDYSQALKLLLRDGIKDERQSTAARLEIWIDALTRLNYPEAATRYLGAPDWYAAVLRSQRPPPTSVRGKAVTAADFWEMPCLFNFGGRALVNLGKGQELVGMYRERFGDADGFISGVRPAALLVYEVPTLAIALRAGGRATEADYLLAAAATRAETAVRLAPRSAERMAMLAYVRAAQGRREEAVRLLASANALGWLPDGRLYAMDLAQEPAFAVLLSDPRFRAVRKRVLDHIATERAELGPLTI